MKDKTFFDFQLPYYTLPWKAINAYCGQLESTSWLEITLQNNFKLILEEEFTKNFAYCSTNI